MISIIENPYKSIQVETDEGNIVTIKEGDSVEFVVESTAEVIKGIVTKFASKDEKLKVQIFSAEKVCEQIWPVVAMSEGSLKLVEDNEDNE